METPEYQHRNLLVLDRSVHKAWSESEFSLNPLPGVDPAELLLQFDWLHQDRPGSVEHTQGDHSHISDGRRDATAYHLRTGDQVRLFSHNPAKCPLPARFLLGLAYSVNKVCRATAAAGPLELLFRDFPPDMGDTQLSSQDDDDGYQDETPPEFYNYLLRSALEIGTLTPTRAERWRRYLIVSGGDNDSDDSRGSDGA